MRKFNNKIICPCCSAEYLCSEIYVPDALVGKPREVDKNAYGRIKKVYGDNASNEEEYICDFCNTKFYVYAKMLFRTSIKKDETFEEEYSLNVSGDKVEMQED